MNSPQTSLPRAMSAAPPSAGSMPERWRSAGRVGWGGLVVFTLTVVAADLPGYFAQLRTICAGTGCLYNQLTPEQAAALSGVGWSPDVYSAVQVALMLASVLLCVVVSTLLVWRRAHDRMALLVALMLVPLGPANMAATLLYSPSPWQVPTACLFTLALALFVFVFLLFPGGRFVPRWTRWTFAAFLPGFLPTAFFGVFITQFGWFILVGESIIVVVAQVYRYRRVSSPLGRQQTKWVVFALAVSPVVGVVDMLLGLLFPALADPTTPAGASHGLILNSFYSGIALLIPLTFGVAILRYRLWEIDTIINKALVYGLLTGLLGTLYAGLILGLESLAGLLTGQQEQPVVLVVSTLAIAALFLPVRRRLQALIDRRFYRKKYDAEQTLAAFSATLRNQVDLEQIRAQLLSVVRETMQPASLSLWLHSVKPPMAEDGTRTAARFPAEASSSAERLEAP